MYRRDMTHFPYDQHFSFFHRFCIDNFQGRYQGLFAFFYQHWMNIILDYEFGFFDFVSFCI